MDETIQKQIEAVQGLGSKTLHELIIFIFLIQVSFSAMVWFDTAWLTRPFTLIPPWSKEFAWFIANSYMTATLIISIVFLISIVAYFWRGRNIPLFQVLFIGNKEKQRFFIDREEERRQLDKKHFVTSFLLPAGISIGLAFTTMTFAPYPEDWWSSEHTLLWSYQHNPLCYYPLVGVVCSCMLLYFAYRMKPAYVENNIPALFYIPVLMSLGTVTYSTVSVLLMVPVSKILQFIALTYARIAFLVSFVLLSYLIYHFITQDRKAYTLAEEGHLKGLIEKGVWILPKKVRVGDSHSISLYVELSNYFVNRPCSGKCSYEKGDSLEAGIQAVELKVDGHKKRFKIFESSPIPLTTWNCSFPTPGWHTINLTIDAVKQIDNVRDTVFAQEHKIKVDSSLNASTAPMLAIITPILLTIVQAYFKVHFG